MKDIRKLAVLSSGFSAAVFAAHYLVPQSALRLMIALSLALAALTLLLKGLTRKRALLAAVGLLLGFCCYSVNSETLLIPCSELDGRTLRLSARVTDYKVSFDYGDMLYVRFTDERIPKADGVIFDYNGYTDELQPGDMVLLTVKLRAADERYNVYSDMNISKGLYIVGTLKAEAEYVGRWEHSWLYFPKYLGSHIRETISDIFPEDTSGFMLALLSGSKTEYYKDDSLSNAISLSGLAHVVAVSGMHVAFLIGFVRLFVRQDRLSSLLCIAAVWVFVVMVGAPSSAVRAGIMQTMLLLAPMVGRSNDSATSLSFALAIILLENPFAAGSVGLQLSFGAMAGIFLFSGKVYEHVKQKIRPGYAPLGNTAHYLLGVFSSSVGATVFTVPLIAVHFGYISTYMFLGNILCLWAVSLSFITGYIACFIGFVLPTLGSLAAAVVAYVVRYIIFCAKLIAHLPLAALYTENTLIVLWLVLTYLLFGLFIYKYRKKFSAVKPIALSLMCLALALFATRVCALRDPGTAAVLSVGNAQSIVMTSRGSSVVVDCGNAGVADNAGFQAASYIQSGGRYHVDCLLLTHLHKDHANGAVRLMNLMDVDLILMPENARQSADESLLAEILELAEENGTEVLYIGSDTELEFDGIRLEIYAPSERGSKNERCITLTAVINGCRMLITGDANMAVERDLVVREELGGTDVLIVGHHGSKYSTSDELLDAAWPSTAIISTGYNNYGHPTETVLNKLRERGITTLRTDLDGRINIKTG